MLVALQGTIVKLALRTSKTIIVQPVHTALKILVYLTLVQKALITINSSLSLLLTAKSAPWENNAMRGKRIKVHLAPWAISVLLGLTPINGHVHQAPTVVIGQS